MSSENILYVFVIVYCLYSIGDVNVIASKQSIKEDSFELDCSQFSNDLDILQKLPFPVELSDSYPYHEKSTAEMNDDGTIVEVITIKNESLVPSNIFCLSNLTTLRIISTPFENDIVPDALANLKALKILYIQYVSIINITKQFSTLTNLMMLTFFNCSLIHLPDLHNLHRLKLMYLPYNNLTQVDELLNLDLVLLDLAGNHLTEIPILKNKQDLLHLSLSHNPLKNVESVMLYHNLTSLSLHNVPLTTIPQNIDKLQNLERLFLGGDQWNYFPPDLFKLPKLRSLYILPNQFSSDDIESIKETFKTQQPMIQLSI